VDEQIALIRTIAANPEDDTPRLIYADWLDESGSELNRERAEFIRLHVHMATLPLDSEERQQIRSQSLPEMLPLIQAWWKELPVIPNLTWGWFERGFVEHVIGFFRTLREHHETIFDTAPVVSVNLTYFAQAEFEEMIESPWMERITRLEFQNADGRGPGTSQPFQLNDETTQRLLDANCLNRVTQLSIRNVPRRDRRLITRLRERFAEVRT
jgi:uncharacterized protein (TIGR02996 family)